MTRLELIEMRESGRLLVGSEAEAAASSMRMFKSGRELHTELRRHVMLKWVHQHHVMELSDGGETFNFMGVPEW